ncbi:hypothetical protein EJ06DRAFT_538552 [Trichodelitschia bisporula]|uniref:C2H2-type domain-containing protein n=1 Tax=Trichodelitschia bisporula TaxID=703511 RepID=A0A6G1HTB6_9PEZI|nr:hypothetical protein EJ06DRAFT_538552 [Trichodelitschia bisporula]
MAIPNAREAVPPPLPPPRYIEELGQGQDAAWAFQNRHQVERYNAPVKGSLLGGSSDSGISMNADRYGHHDSRKNSYATQDDDADGTDSQDADRRDFRLQNKLRGELQLGARNLNTSSQAYDKQLLSKIGGPAADRTPGFYYSGASPSEAQRHSHRLPPQLAPLNVPENRYASLDSPHNHWGASSAGLSPASYVRSPIIDNNSLENAYARRKHGSSTPDGFEDTTSGHRSQRNSEDHGVFLDPELGVEDHERSPSTGTDQGKGRKRRASSPLADSVRDDRAVGPGNDLYRRRSQQRLAIRGAPPPRFPAAHGSLASTASLATRAGSSWASEYNFSVASAATSYNGDRLSPSALSPSAPEMEYPASPFGRRMDRSPRGSISQMVHHRRPSEAESHARQPASRQNSISGLHIHHQYICECCPKKPKKFETEKELADHQAEKQYRCAYCNNRFKNKNEAERHQNSLHLRRYSWSCNSLKSVQAAFHNSTIHPTTADVCGYCGQEFPNPADWEARAEHLCQVHKYGECNQGKKFYRADHFRQHLKHSHSGTSGKWTNQLETACMQDEPPQPMLADRLPSVIPAGLSLLPPPPMIPPPGVLGEVREEM